MVIVILGLLAAIVVINVVPFGDKARVVKAKADIATIESALNAYQLSMGSFPVHRGRAERAGRAARWPDRPVAISKGRLYQENREGSVGPALSLCFARQHGAFDVWSLGADGKEGGQGADADIGSWQ